jgi:hypothetical protein
MKFYSDGRVVVREPSAGPVKIATVNTAMLTPGLLAQEIADALNKPPTDARATLDRIRQEAREEALREAAGLADELAIEMEVYHAIPATTTKSKALCIRNRILALIEKDKTDG